MTDAPEPVEVEPSSSSDVNGTEISLTETSEHEN